MPVGSFKLAVPCMVNSFCLAWSLHHNWPLHFLKTGCFDFTLIGNLTSPQLVNKLSPNGFALAHHAFYPAILKGPPCLMEHFGVNGGPKI
eukprot:6491595-Amphidinium_carterae.3